MNLHKLYRRPRGMYFSANDRGEMVGGAVALVCMVGWIVDGPWLAGWLAGRLAGSALADWPAIASCAAPWLPFFLCRVASHMCV